MQHDQGGMVLFMLKYSTIQLSINWYSGLVILESYGKMAKRLDLIKDSRTTDLLIVDRPTHFHEDDKL